MTASRADVKSLTAESEVVILPQLPKVDAENPWPGLEAYDEASCDFFYGRKPEATELVRLVQRAPLTVIYGKSGLGKTSLLQAGLFPLLRDQHFFPVLKRLDFAEGMKYPPLQQMQQELLSSLDRAHGDYPSIESHESLWEYLHRKDTKFWSADNFPLIPVLVFDQFEELFSRTGGNAEIVHEVFDGLADLIENRIPAELTKDSEGPRRSRLDLLSQRYCIVLSFREDFLPEIRKWERQVPSLLRNYLRLEPMSHARAIEAIQQAGKAVLEDGVAPHIVDLVADHEQRSDGVESSEMVIEPVLLSLCCTQLNLRRAAEKRIDKDLVDKAGQDILESFYRGALEDPAVRGEPDVASFIEDYLIQGDRYRGDYPKREALEENKLRSDQLAALTDRHRLLRIIHRGDTARIELIHDRLVPVVRKARDERRVRAQHEAQVLKARQAEEERDKERARSEALRQQAKRLQLAFAIVAMLAVAAALAAGWALRESSWAKAAERNAKRSGQDAIAAKLRAETSERNAIAEKQKADQSEQDAIAAKLRAETSERNAIAEKREADKSEQDAIAAKLRAEKSEQDAIAAKTVAETSEQNARAAAEAAAQSERSKEIAVGTSRMAEGRQALQANSEPLEQTMYRALATFRLSTGVKEMSEARVPSLSALELVLDRSGHLAKVVRLPGTMPTPALAYSPDGKTLAVGGEDGLVRLMDAEDYHEISQPLDCRQQGVPDRVWSLAFNQDGTRLAAGYAGESAEQKERGKGLVCVFDVRRGSVRKWSSAEHGGKGADVYTVAYGGRPGAEFAAFGGSDKVLRRWDLQTGSVVEVSIPAAVVAVTLNNDESKIAVGDEDGRIRIWNMAGLDNPNGQFTELRGHKATIEQMVFSSTNPRVLVSAGDDGRILIWNIENGGCQTAQSKLQDAKIFGIAINKDDIVAAAGGDGYVRLFRLPTNVATCAATKAAEKSGATPMSPPEFDVVPEGVLSGHGGMVLAVAFDPGGDRMASAGQDGSIRVWMSNTGSFSLSMLSLDPNEANGNGTPGLQAHGQVKSVAISPDKSKIVAGDNKGNIFLWTAPREIAVQNGRQGEPQVRNAMKEWKAHDLAIRSVTFLMIKDRLAVVSGGNDGVLKRWDVGSQEMIGSPMADDAKPIVSIALSPDGKLIAAGSHDGTVRLWGVESGTLIKKILPAPDEPDFRLSAVGFSRDGEYLGIGSSWYQPLRLVNLQNYQDHQLYGHNRGISTIAHGDLEWLVSSGEDGSVLEWQDAALKQPKSQGLKKRDDFQFGMGFPELRHPQPVTAMSTSADGRLILTGGREGQIQLWDGKEHVLISDQFSAYDKKIEAVALAHDGSFFVTADASKILVWPGPDNWADIICSKLVWNMSRRHWDEWVSPSIPYTDQCPGLPQEPSDVLTAGTR